MTALTYDRRVDVVAGDGARYRVAKVAAGVKIFKGALIARNGGGFAVPAADVAGLRVIGLAQEQVDNTFGADGAVEVTYLTGLSFAMKNDTASPVVQANLLGVVYAKDDQTVQANTSHGVVAGFAESIELDGTVVIYSSPELSVSAVDASAQLEVAATATALSISSRYSLLNPTGTMVMPLAAGVYIGQPKTIRMIGGSATPISNVTGNFVTDGTATTQAQFNATGDQLELAWNGSAWQVLNNVSVTLS